MATENVEFSKLYRKPRILLAASGSVVAMKFGNLYRSLSEWAEVKAVATNTALKYLDKKSLPRDAMFYTDEEDLNSWEWVGDEVLHIELQNWADILIIAPLSANTLAKMSEGICDNLLTCIVRAWDYDKLMVVAPAMNASMWKNPLTKRHLKFIFRHGIANLALDSDNGVIASPFDIDSVVRIYVQDQQSEQRSRQNQHRGAASTSGNN